MAAAAARSLLRSSASLLRAAPARSASASSSAARPSLRRALATPPRILRYGTHDTRRWPPAQDKMKLDEYQLGKLFFTLLPSIHGGTYDLAFDCKLILMEYDGSLLLEPGD
uniref:Uncharacterized protein n=1 Tax=Oryza meridionalis TaxID=40149 RepID=A0A0E0BZR4_9ORYZ